MTRAVKSVGLLLAAFTALVTLGACSGSSGSASMNHAAAGLVPAQARRGGPATAPSAPSAPSEPGATADTKRASGGAKAQLSVSDPRALVRTASMTVDVRGSGKVAGRADAADDIVQSAGGEIDSDDRTSGKHATATLRLRVPPAALQRVLNHLARLGTEKSRLSSTADVTTQVADVNSRVKSAQVVIDELRSLYRRVGNQTGKASDLLDIENELATRESDLEALQAEQRALTRQTDMATITLLLRTAAVRPVVTKHPVTRHGFVGGLLRGWHGFVTAAVWVASAFATLLPFLVLLALVLAALWKFGVRLRIPRSHQS